MASLFSFSFFQLIGLSIQAAKILANLVVMGSGILGRAFVQAYRQALTSFLVINSFYSNVPYLVFLYC